MCPVTPQAAKLVDKFIGIMSKARTDIDLGTISAEYPTWNPNSENPFTNYDMDNVDESHHLDDVNATTDSSEDENP